MRRFSSIIFTGMCLVSVDSSLQADFKILVNGVLRAAVRKAKHLCNRWPAVSMAEANRRSTGMRLVSIDSALQADFKILANGVLRAAVCKAKP